MGSRVGDYEMTLQDLDVSSNGEIVLAINKLIKSVLIRSQYISLKNPGEGNIIWQKVYKAQDRKLVTSQFQNSETILIAFETDQGSVSDIAMMKTEDGSVYKQFYLGNEKNYAKASRVFATLLNTGILIMTFSTLDQYQYQFQEYYINQSTIYMVDTNQLESQVQATQLLINISSELYYDYTHLTNPIVYDTYLYSLQLRCNGTKIDLTLFEQNMMDESLKAIYDVEYEQAQTLDQCKTLNLNMKQYKDPENNNRYMYVYGQDSFQKTFFNRIKQQNANPDNPEYTYTFMNVDGYIRIFDVKQTAASKYYMLLESSASIGLGLYDWELQTFSIANELGLKDSVSPLKTFYVGLISSPTQFYVGGITKNNHQKLQSRNYNFNVGYLYSNKDTSFINLTPDMSQIDDPMIQLTLSQLEIIYTLYSRELSILQEVATFQDEDINFYGFDIVLDETFLYTVGLPKIEFFLDKLIIPNCIDMASLDVKIKEPTSWISFNLTTYMTTIYTEDNNLVGDFQKYIQVFHGDNQYLVNQFSVKIQHQCTYAVMTPNATEILKTSHVYQIYNDGYIASMGQPVYSYQIPLFSSNDTNCPVEYAMLTNLTDIKMSFLTFNKLTATIRITTNDSENHWGDRLAQVKVFIGNSSYSTTLNFTFYLIHECQTTTMQGNLFNETAPYLYYQIKPTNTQPLIIPFNNYTFWQANACPYLEYRLQGYNWDNVTLPFISVKANKMEVLTQNVSVAGLYKLNLYGSNYHKYGREFFMILLTIVDCTTITAVPTIIPELIYNIYDYILIHNFIPFELSSPECGPMKYNISETTNKTINMPGIYVQVDYQEPDFNDGIRIESQSISSAGETELQYQALLWGRAASGFEINTTFIYTLVNTCRYGKVLPASGVSDIVYYVNQPDHQKGIYYFTSNLTNFQECGTPAVEILKTIDVNGNTYSQDGLPFSYQNPIYHILNTKNETYKALSPFQIDYLGYFSKYKEYSKYELTRNLTIDVNCQYNEITGHSNIEQDYIIGSGTPLTISPFTYTQIFNTYCNLPSVFSCTNLTSNLACNLGFFTFNSTNGEIRIETNDVVWEGTHSLQIIGDTLVNYKISYTVTLTLINLCIGVNILKQPIFFETYQHDVSETPLVKGPLGWTHDGSRCLSKITFQVYNITPPLIGEGTLLSQSIAYVNNTTQLLYIVASDSSLASLTGITSTLRIVGILGEAKVYAKDQVDFDLILTDQCQNGQTQNLSSLQDQEYTIGNAKLSYQIPNFSVNPSICGPIVFSIEEEGNADMISAAHIDSEKGLFTFESNNISYEGNYIINIYSTIKYGKYRLESFHLSIINPCSTAQLSHGFNQFIYDYWIKDGALIIKMNKFISTQSSLICGDIDLEISDIYGQDLPQFFQYRDTTQEFQVFTNDSYYANKVYEINVVASQGNLVLSLTFTINMKISCRHDTMSESYSTTYPLKTSYIVGDDQFNIDLDHFNSLQNCEYEITCYDNKTQSACNQIYGATFYFYDSLNLEMSIVTSNNLDRGTYNFTMIANNSEGILISFQIQIEITATCSTNVILIENFIEKVSYDVNDYESRLLQTLSWKSELDDICYPMEFILTYLPEQSIFALDQYSRELTIIIKNENYTTGDYTIIVNATIQETFKTAEFLLRITDNCKNNQFIKSELDPYYEYTIGQSLMNISFGFWKTKATLQSYCGPINYRLRHQNGEDVDDVEIIQLDEVRGKIMVFSTNVQRAANYTIQLEGYLKPKNYTKLRDYTQIIIEYKEPTTVFKKEVDCTNVTVQYIPVVPDIEYIIGSAQTQKTKQTIELWTSSIKGCPFSEYKAYFVGIELPIKGIVDFKIDEKTLYILSYDLEVSPTQGTYQITYEAKLPNGKIHQTFQTLKISIDPSYYDQEIVEEREQLALIQEIFGESETEVTVGGKRIRKDSLKKDLFCWITKISQDGYMTVQFSSFLAKVKDVKMIQKTKALNLKYRDLANNQNKDHKYDRGFKSWSVLSIDDDIMILEVDWINPVYISTGNDYDKIQIKFNQPYFFVSQNLNQIIDKDTEIDSDIPPQLSEGTTQLMKTADGATTALTSAVSVNFILSLFMGLSLKNLWMLLNTLQILVHIPLLKIALPSNSLYFFHSVNAIANLDFVPKDEIKRRILSFMSDGKSSVSGRFQVMDIFQTNQNDYLISQLFHDIIKQILYQAQAQCSCLFYLQQFLAQWLLLVLEHSQSLQLFFQTTFYSLDESISQQKYGTLYLGLRTDQRKALNFMVFFMVRRLIMALSICFILDSPVFQMMVQIQTSLFMLAYIIYVRPQVESKMIFLEAFNEFSILGVSYLLIPFSLNDMDGETRYNMGWYIVALLVQIYF
eukprot:403358044